MKKKKLTQKQREAIEKRARVECAYVLLSDDIGEVLKHRELPDEVTDEVYDLADRYLFRCIEKIGRDLMKKGA